MGMLNKTTTKKCVHVHKGLYTACTFCDIKYTINIDTVGNINVYCIQETIPLGDARF